MIERAAEIVGTPVALETLKHKPGRRTTLRASGPRCSAIIKRYASDRAAIVARRVAALGAGPAEPVVPEVLWSDPALHLVILSDVRGVPLRDLLLGGDAEAGRRAGRAIGAWHAAWLGLRPEGLLDHTIDREIELLLARAATTPASIAAAVEQEIGPLLRPWQCRTVVHRDLYEDQVLMGRLVGLIDLDDAAFGPPELDIGNLLAHIELLERRRDLDLAGARAAILEGYRLTGPDLDGALLARCRALTLLRLACLNADPDLVVAARMGSGVL